MKPSKKANITHKKPAVDVVRKTLSASNKTNTNSSLFDFLELHFQTHQKAYLFLVLGLASIFSFLCFDNKISLANDDALYIESGARYAKDFFAKESFYLASAPLYPTLLGIIIKIFGVKLIILKMFSILFFCIGLYLLFIAFRNRIPYIVLIPSLILTAINFPFLMFASLTYTECLYLLIIGLCMYINFKCFDKILNNELPLKEKILPAILVGSTTFLFLITRNIAVIAIVPIVLFLLSQKKFSEAGIASAVFVFLYFFYRFLIKLIWHVDQSQYEGQKLVFQKDAYNPSAGMETTAGYFTRLIDNAQIYIGQRFMYVLGWKEEMASQMPTVEGKVAEINDTNKLIVVVCSSLLMYALYQMYKNKQHYLLFSTLFFSCLLGATFIALQTSWGQTRFIMIYLPLILMSVFYLLYLLGKKYSFTQVLLPFLFFILFISSIKLTLKNAAERFPVFVENVKGDPTYGFTPDWQNYIKMTKWCAQNLPNDTKTIAVRKAPMSFIFSDGKEFFPIYNAPYQETPNTADSLLSAMRSSKINYFMLAELRTVPDRYIENQFISTVHRYMYFVQIKYPEVFQFVHQEGDLEKAQLYKVNWPYIDSIQKMNR